MTFRVRPDRERLRRGEAARGRDHRPGVRRPGRLHLLGQRRRGHVLRLQPGRHDRWALLGRLGRPGLRRSRRCGVRGWRDLVRGPAVHGLRGEHHGLGLRGVHRRLPRRGELHQRGR
ncbi:MAG: hypothetical protein MZW92_01990 [Comamonadaceae bacterium]|nr:hypothetical protein [Comamonadaceae bacterium]